MVLFRPGGALLTFGRAIRGLRGNKRRCRSTPGQIPSPPSGLGAVMGRVPQAPLRSARGYVQAPLSGLTTPKQISPYREIPLTLITAHTDHAFPWDPPHAFQRLGEVLRLDVQAELLRRRDVAAAGELLDDVDR